MSGQTVILVGDSQRRYAKALIDDAKERSQVRVSPPTRTRQQEKKFWAMMGDIVKADPEERGYSKEQWKCVFMKGLGYEIDYLLDLDGRPFPDQLSSRKLTEKQYAELIEFVYAQAAVRGWDVPWGGK